MSQSIYQSRDSTIDFQTNNRQKIDYATTQASTYQQINQAINLSISYHLRYQSIPVSNN